MPHVVRLKTLICKAVGVLFSVAGGKERLKTLFSLLTKRWLGTEDIPNTVLFCT